MTRRARVPAELPVEKVLETVKIVGLANAGQAIENVLAPPG